MGLARGLRTLCLAALGALVACEGGTSRPPEEPSATKPVRAAAAEKEPAPPPPEGSIDAVLEQAFLADSVLAPYVRDATRRRLQVLVTLPTIDPNGVRAFKRFVYRVDAEYFYPASAIKLFLAASAVEKLEELRKQPGGAALDLKTPLRFVEGEGARRRVADTTLSAELERALIVSDNEASNRLLEFVGKEELHARLRRVGLQRTRIVHALGNTRGRDPVSSIELLPPKSQPFAVEQLFGEAIPDPPAQVFVGNTYIDDRGRTVSQPMDFTNKNSSPLHEMQDYLIALTRPDLMTGEVPRIKKYRERLLEILGTLPSRMGGGAGDKKLDDLYKPLHAAILNTLPKDKIRVYGKSGRAFGFLVENSLAIDDTTKRSMFVTAAIYANDSERLNDDGYEYSAVAAPFVARLGSVLARAFLAAP